MTTDLSGQPRFRVAFGRGWQEASVYLRHVLVLLWPGGDPGGFTVHPSGPGDVAGWSEDSLRLLVEEGRRQLDRQRSDFDSTQGRAQFLFTAAVALLAVFSSQVGLLRNVSGFLVASWAAGLLAILLGLLGAAALMSTRGMFGMVDACLLSRETDPPVLQAVAQGYANAVPVGENTVATRVTVLRDAVFLTTVGGASQGALWVFLSLA